MRHLTLILALILGVGVVDRPRADTIAVAVNGSIVAEAKLGREDRDQIVNWIIETRRMYVKCPPEGQPCWINVSLLTGPPPGTRQITEEEAWVILGKEILNRTMTIAETYWRQRAEVEAARAAAKAHRPIGRVQ